MLALVIVGRHQADERISQKVGEHGRRFPRVVIHSMRSSRTAPSGIYAISGTLEKSLVEIFMRDHAGRLEQARQRLPDAMGATRTRKARRHKAPQESHPAMTSVADTNTAGTGESRRTHAAGGPSTGQDWPWCATPTDRPGKDEAIGSNPVGPTGTTEGPVSLRRYRAFCVRGGVRAACACRGSPLSAVRLALLGDRLRRGRLWWGLTGRPGAVVARGTVQRREGVRGRTKSPRPV